jgi:NAD(P)-dependent dehydrogenase (short-subunit alcohol dehydrogenase family)
VTLFRAPASRRIVATEPGRDCLAPPHQDDLTLERPELLGTRLFDLTGRVALVTGAGRGLGRTMALALAAAGASLVVASRSIAELDTLVEEIEQLGRPAKAVTCDVTDEQSCDALVQEAVARMGQLDILVNNAGINVRKPVLELSYEEFDRVLRTNLHGYFLTAKAAGRVMVAQGSGKVINISSILGRVALAEQAAYASSKGAIEQLTRVLALEWAEANVQVNAIGPTYFETELTRPLFEDQARNAFITGRTPMKRWGQPHELAGAVIFLASRASDYVTGHTLMVDGGWTAW